MLPMREVQTVSSRNMNETEFSLCMIGTVLLSRKVDPVLLPY